MRGARVGERGDEAFVRVVGGALDEQHVQRETAVAVVEQRVARDAGGERAQRRRASSPAVRYAGARAMPERHERRVGRAVRADRAQRIAAAERDDDVGVAERARFDPASSPPVHARTSIAARSAGCSSPSVSTNAATSASLRSLTVTAHFASSAKTSGAIATPIVVSLETIVTAPAPRAQRAGRPARCGETVERLERTEFAGDRRP